MFSVLGPISVSGNFDSIFNDYGAGKSWCPLFVVPDVGSHSTIDDVGLALDHGLGWGPSVKYRMYPTSNDIVF